MTTRSSRVMVFSCMARSRCDGEHAQPHNDHIHLQVALNLVPSKDAFLQCVAPGEEEQQTAQLHRAVAAFRPVLQAVHAFLDQEGLDDPTPV